VETQAVIIRNENRKAVDIRKAIDQRNKMRLILEKQKNQLGLETVIDNRKRAIDQRKAVDIMRKTDIKKQETLEKGHCHEENEINS
jgi:hypothetical protein